MRAWLLCLALAAPGAQAADGKLKAGTFDPPRAAPDFSLEGSDGAELKLSRYRGKVVVLGFGFSHCEYVCPTTLSTLAKARRKLGRAGEDMQVVYLTVDPERDDAARLRSYLANFDASFVGGTGASASLAKVRQEYGITATKQPTSDPGVYFWDHSSFVYLIDRAGSLRAMVPYGKSAEDIAHDVAILLKP